VTIPHNILMHLMQSQHLVRTESESFIDLRLTYIFELGFSGATDLHFHISFF